MTLKKEEGKCLSKSFPSKETDRDEEVKRIY